MRLYNPWSQLELDRTDMYGVDWEEEEFSDERDRKYDLGRINYFANLFSVGKRVDPISVDNYCAHNFIYPEPLVTDGHHRLCGADLANAEKIPSYYSGRVDLLRYLKGLRKTKPE